MSDNKKFWNRQAKKFSESGNKESKELLEKIKPYLSSDSELLDFACGTGQSTHLLSDHVNKAIGLDYSDEMIRFASENKNNNTDFLTGTLDHKSLEKGNFDVVVALNVLHLLDNLDDSLKKIQDLLKTNGYFISYTPCLGDKKSLWVKMIRLFSRLKLLPDIYPLTSQLLIDQLSQSGFVKEYLEVDGDMVKNTFLVMRKEDSHEET